MNNINKFCNYIIQLKWKVSVLCLGSTAWKKYHLHYVWKVTKAIKMSQICWLPKKSRHGAVHKWKFTLYLNRICAVIRQPLIKYKLIESKKCNQQQKQILLGRLAHPFKLNWFIFNGVQNSTNYNIINMPTSTIIINQPRLKIDAIFKIMACKKRSMVTRWMSSFYVFFFAYNRKMKQHPKI